MISIIYNRFEGVNVKLYFLLKKNSDKNGFNILGSLCEKPLNQTRIYE